LYEKLLIVLYVSTVYGLMFYFFVIMMEVCYSWFLEILLVDSL